MTSEHVVVAGAGIVGLCTAWFLQEHGARVTIIDRAGIASGASYGNAGWIMPRRALPITEPSSIREGVTGMFHRDGPFRIASWSRPQTWRFLTAFALNSTPRRWDRARGALAGLNDTALDAFDEMTDDAIPAPEEAPIIAAFAAPSEADHLTPGADLEALPPDSARALVPQLAATVGAVVRMSGTRYIAPPSFAHGLASALERRGATIERGDVTEVLPGPRLILTDRTVDADAVVLAVGVRLHALTRRLGVSVPVAAGRGYSFFAPTDSPVPGPIYLPTERLACTPAPGGLRVAGIMEITAPEAPASTRAFESMARGAARLLTGVRLDERSAGWSGDRPLTADGLPVIGRTALDGVHVAGGHGMWGVTQGAATGRLLAESIMTGRTPKPLVPLSPLR